MTDARPGLGAQRLTDLMRGAVARCRLDLTGLTVLTEAASGAYSVTPVLAAMAGARVLAMTRTTRYGTADEVKAATRDLARLAGVDDRIEIIAAADRGRAAEADLVTNSGHVRPIDRAMVASLKPGAVVSLMYESWEYRAGDVDLDACADAAVPVGGTNERHPDIDVFSFLGLMAVRLLLEAGVAVYHSSLLLVCDNPFKPYLERGLKAAGASVETVERLTRARSSGLDAIVVSLTPRRDPVVQAGDAAIIARRWPGAVVAQFWGDVDRAACAAAGIPVWRPDAPGAGHMGILLSDLGPEPIVRLQTGGLKAGEVLWRLRAGQSGVDQSYLDPIAMDRGVRS